MIRKTYRRSSGGSSGGSGDSATETIMNKAQVQAPNGIIKLDAGRTLRIAAAPASWVTEIIALHWIKVV